MKHVKHKKEGDSRLYSPTATIADKAMRLISRLDSSLNRG